MSPGVSGTLPPPTGSQLEPAPQRVRKDLWRVRQAMWGGDKLGGEGEREADECRCFYRTATWSFDHLYVGAAVMKVVEANSSLCRAEESGQSSVRVAHASTNSRRRRERDSDALSAFALGPRAPLAGHPPDHPSFCSLNGAVPIYRRLGQAQRDPAIHAAPENAGSRKCLTQPTGGCPLCLLQQHGSRAHQSHPSAATLRRPPSLPPLRR